MQLITDDDTFPSLYATEDLKADDKILQARFYEPSSNWVWYLTEYDPNENLAFGYVIGFEQEWGYFSLTEMQEIPTILRDKSFVAIYFKDLK
jgi:hypothetical protein